MRKSVIAFLAASVGVVASPAYAWWDEGHMQIAYIAYKRLDSAVRDRAVALLKLNPDYDHWTAGAPDAETAKLYAFVHAATWADDIKTKRYGYRRDATIDPNAGREHRQRVP
jgi:hypothetical protein